MMKADLYSKSQDGKPRKDIRVYDVFSDTQRDLHFHVRYAIPAPWLCDVAFGGAGGEEKHHVDYEESFFVSLGRDSHMFL
jgi:hypothetical protein